MFAPSHSTPTSSLPVPVPVPKTLPNLQASTHQPKIPRNVWQAFLRSDYSQPAPALNPLSLPQIVKARARGMRNNPEFTFRTHNDEEADAFIREHFDADVYRAFSSLRWGVIRADFWRYCILYVHGGVYVDMDSALDRAPLRELIRPDDSAIIAFEREWPCPSTGWGDAHARDRMIKMVYNVSGLSMLEGESAADRSRHGLPEKTVTQFMLVFEPRHAILDAWIREQTAIINAWQDAARTHSVGLVMKEMYTTGPCMITTVLRRKLANGELASSSFRLYDGWSYFASDYRTTQAKGSPKGWKVQDGFASFKLLNATHRTARREQRAAARGTPRPTHESVMY